MSVQNNILPGADPASIEHAAEVLRAGGLVGMPTETVYGLAANALDTAAVAKVFEAKARPSFDPLIVHLASADDAQQYAELDETSRRLAQAFWPGPLTLVLPRRRGEMGGPVVPDLVTAGLDAVGLRVPAHAVAHSLLEASGLPLAAPSANRFGSISPTTAQHVADELGGRVDTILDGGPCGRGVESTVVRVMDGVIQVLRLGALPVEAIEQHAGRSVDVLKPSSSPGKEDLDSAKPAPGMTQRHYAPRTRMVVSDSEAELIEKRTGKRVGLIGMGRLPEGLGCIEQRNLSESGDLAEAAANLFAVLRELDGLGLDEIMALRVPDEGLGRAINDRLKRGSAR